MEPLINEAEAMRVMIEPPMATWRIKASDGRPIVATGHQAGFWHPGILAKCIAAKAAAEQVGGRALYVLVDHDDNESGRIDVPVIDQGRLHAEMVEIFPSQPGVALRAQLRIDWDDALHRISEMRRRMTGRLAVEPAAIDRLRQAVDEARTSEDARAATRAEQWAALLQAMWRPLIGELAIIHATSLIDDAIVTSLLNDATACVRCYNDAVAAQPKAGMTPLRIERDRVELPLWSIGDAGSNARRRRVFADLSDSRPMLSTEEGEPVEWTGRGHVDLAPRALLLTALMRSKWCDLFIHGHGGGVYDHVMERWWGAWTGRPLAPMAVVSADVRLPFAGVAKATMHELARSVWYRHHLPHNLDRELPVSVADGVKVSRKRTLLNEIDAISDRRERAARFREMHRINLDLQQEHADLIALAQQQVEQTTLGVANQSTALRRDWCHLLYDPMDLQRLADRIVGEAGGIARS